MGNSISGTNGHTYTISTLKLASDVCVYQWITNVFCANRNGHFNLGHNDTLNTLTLESYVEFGPNVYQLIQMFFDTNQYNT